MWNPCAGKSTGGSGEECGVSDTPDGCGAPTRDRHRGGAGYRPGVEGKERTTGMTDAPLARATVWAQIRERLATSLSPQQNAMLNLARPLGLVEDTAVLAAPNEFTQTVLESRMRRGLAGARSEGFRRALPAPVRLQGPPPPRPPPRGGEPR